MQAADIRRVGIIGAGHIGQAMARIALRAGREVVIANSRGPASLAPVVQELGGRVSAGTVEYAAAADIVVVAVMWPDVPQADDARSVAISRILRISMLWFLRQTTL